MGTLFKKGEESKLCMAKIEKLKQELAGECFYQEKRHSTVIN